MDFNISSLISQPTGVVAGKSIRLAINLHN